MSGLAALDEIVQEVMDSFPSFSEVTSQDERAAEDDYFSLASHYSANLSWYYLLRVWHQELRMIAGRRQWSYRDAVVFNRLWKCIQHRWFHEIVS